MLFLGWIDSLFFFLLVIEGVQIEEDDHHDPSIPKRPPPAPIQANPRRQISGRGLSCTYVPLNKITRSSMCQIVCLYLYLSKLADFGWPTDGSQSDTPKIVQGRALITMHATSDSRISGHQSIKQDQRQ